jgi:hypothetical protein
VSELRAGCRAHRFETRVRVLAVGYCNDVAVVATITGYAAGARFEYEEWANTLTHDADCPNHEEAR